MKPHLRVVAPTTVNRTVTPRRRPNAEIRTREHLTERRGREADQGGWQEPLGSPGCDHDPGGLPAWAARQRTGRSCAGIRSILSCAVLHVRRVKQGTPATHPILGDEMRALRQLQREQEPKSPFVFTSERGSPFITSGLCQASGARW